MKEKSDAARISEGKLIGLDEAVRRFVSPGMQVHLAGGIGGPSAAICEMIRQFRGTNPRFTIIQSTLTGHGLNLVHCGLARKLMCAVCPDISSSARPSKIIQKAYTEKTIEMENWSLHSLQQRLMAGAFGVPFMPTRSVRGSTIAIDNETSFREIEDPFGHGTVGVVQALNPDVSIVHGCVADPDGNIIMPAPYGEDVWGPLAAKSVVATVEKVVPTRFIRSYSTLVKIPGHLVGAVCVAPLGLHPFSLPNPGIVDFEPYEKDVDFLVELSTAARGGGLDAWIDEWVLGCPTQQEYLRRLGASRIGSLKERARTVLASPSPPTITGGGRIADVAVDPKQMMLIALGREIAKSVRDRGHKVILAGAGVGSTAAFMAYFQLRPEGREIELLTGNGQIGYTPIPGESILATEAGVRSCKMLTDTVTTQGVFVGGRNNKCLSVLGAGQMDRFGNINSTVTSSGDFLVGSGGANDALNASEVIVALGQSKERFVDALPYITGLGHRVATVVSSMGIFRKATADGELCLAACFPDGKATSLARKIERVKQNCGWQVVVSPEAHEIPTPSPEELQLLEWLASSQGASI